MDRATLTPIRPRQLGLGLAFLLALMICAGPASAQGTYQKPSQDILDVLNAPLPPTAVFSPRRDWIVLAQPVVYPSIADLSEPMLRLAGIRFNPRNNADRSSLAYFTALTLKRVADGAETPIALPAEARRLGRPTWNADGTMFAFTHTTPERVELWVVDIITRRARALPGLRINPLLGSSVQWMPDQRTLLVKLVPEDRGAPPAQPSVPPGPKIQESLGVTAASSTYEARDVLKSPYDEALFDYYAASQLALVRLPSGESVRVGLPGVIGRATPAPGGGYLLVERLHRPYSYNCAFYRFPTEVDILTTAGEPVEKIASLPLFDQVPIEGVPTGPRNFEWHPIEAATVCWTEALDGGNPKTEVPQRDKVMLKPVGAPAVELVRTEERLNDVQWIERSGLALVSDFDPDKRWVRTFLIDPGQRQAGPRQVWSLSADEKYKNPGYPVTRMLPTGASAVLEQNGWIYLDGNGASPDGDRPFLDRLNLRTFRAERLFRCDRSSFEYFVAWVDPAAGTFITRRESPIDPPNFFLRTLDNAARAALEGEAVRTSTSRAITRFLNPAPQIAGIQKRLVTYKRADGIPLSFMLYLPPGYKPGTRLPTVLWAYPLDYAEQGVAGQVEGSSKLFTTIRGSSELFFLLAGYAVLDDAAMPVVGPPETVYDSFVEQITANAQAAIDKAVELGVTDPERVGVAGHSHGALMTANFLAYTDLFRAGIARSGAFNHTLRPFGFQNERRTLYQARDTYIKLSPVIQADKVNEPLLLIHGEIDANPGTVPLQSEKFYDALRGAGKAARLVMLPYESHGYQARESVEHVVYEMISWFDRFVKNAPPRSGRS